MPGLSPVSLIILLAAHPYNDNDISWFYGMTILGDPTLIIHCSKNLPPSGTNLTGPNEGIKGEEYTFCIDVIDHEGDQIFCMWDWGDNTSSEWLGPYDSGTICASHAWQEEGTYEIKVKLKDALHEGNWSDPHIIDIIAGPTLDVRTIKGGLFKVNAVIKNIGAVDSTAVSWTISLNGGAWIGKETTGTLPGIAAGGEESISSDLILGWGETRVTVRAEIPEGSDTRSQLGKLYLFYVWVNPGGV